VADAVACTLHKRLPETTCNMPSCQHEEYEVHKHHLHKLEVDKSIDQFTAGTDVLHRQPPRGIDITAAGRSIGKCFYILGSLSSPRAPRALPQSLLGWLRPSESALDTNSHTRRRARTMPGTQSPSKLEIYGARNTQ